MTDLQKIIQNRRSVFPDQYNADPISKEVIEQILESANWAPTHKKTEPWRFKVLQGESKKRLGEFVAEKHRESKKKPSKFKPQKKQKKFEQSACVIAICMHREPKRKLPEWEEIAAMAMAVQNMWLRCTELGVGAYWSSPSVIEHMDEFFDLKKGEKCYGFFYMGYFDGKLSKGKRSSIEKKTQWMIE